MPRFPVSAALLALAASAPAQSLHFASAERSYFLAAAGFGHDFDGYEWINQSTQDTHEAWTQNALLVLHDYSAQEVSRAHVDHDSLFSGDGMHVAMAVDASAPPAVHFSVDASAQSIARGTFDLAGRSRYALSLNMTTSPQAYSVASAWLTGPAGTMISKQVFQGGTYATSQAGWLQVGTYQFDSQVDSSVQLGVGGSDSTSTTLSFDFQLFQAGDFELDHDVDHHDRWLFRQAYLSSNSSADVDGNGTINQEDWRLFHRAWFNQFFQGIGL